MVHCSELPSNPGARQTVLARGARPVCPRATSELCLMREPPSQVEFQGPREETPFAPPGSAGERRSLRTRAGARSHLEDTCMVPC